MDSYDSCNQVDDIEELVVPFFKTAASLESDKYKSLVFQPDKKTAPEDEINGSVRTLVNGKKRMDPNLNDHQADSFVPGTRKIYMKTWGCSHNSSDSEYMAGLLDRAGYLVQFSNPDSADLWLLNSCTVKTPSETQLQNDIKAALDLGVKVVVAGCVSQGAPQTEWFRGLSLIGVQQIDRVLEVVEETLKGNSVRLMGKRGGKVKGDGTGGAPLTLPKIRKNPLIEILAINTGCLNRCTYCKTKHARGDLSSYSIDQLVDRAKSSFEEGVKELWLTSEDLGAYGHDIGVRLSDLLAALVEVIPDGCMMRLGMTNPPYILHQLDAIADALNHPRVYAFIHIPVQAASDRVLDDMRREYTVADFRQVCDHLISRVPGITIATDVICGFPTETAEDFEETMALVREYRFPVLFINQYYPRPGTPSAKMKRIDTIEVKRRTKALSALFRSYQPYANRSGEHYDVLVSEEATDGEHYVGHNKWYEQVLLPKLPGLMGRRVSVEILQSESKWSMNGKVVKWYDEDVKFKDYSVNNIISSLHDLSNLQLIDYCYALSHWRMLSLAVGIMCFMLAVLVIAS